MGRFDSYSGLLTAYPYAFRQSDSRLFRSYVVVSGLLGALFAFLMAGALVVLVGNTAGARGGSLTLSRTFYVVVGLFVFAPLVGPVLLVARRHRRETPVAPRYDAALGAAGYAFVPRSTSAWSRRCPRSSGRTANWWRDRSPRGCSRQSSSSSTRFRAWPPRWCRSSARWSSTPSTAAMARSEIRGLCVRER